MLLILTHENGDFDAVASLFAAHLLYPEGVPILPRRVNRNVSQFLALYGGGFGFVRQEDWRRQRVDTVLLVDTQSITHVRGVKQTVKVRVIDHHLPGELPADWQVRYAPVGATVTMLVELLQESGVALAPQEATLLLLGIHEDTGSLTYDTSTARDAQAAAWLMGQGAQLGIVRRFLEIPLTEAQQALYQRLQAGTEWLMLEGQSVLLATADAPPDFEDEISSVVHRMRDALVPDGLFVLVGLSQHVQLVARSSNDQIDVAALAARFGGGGHSRASAAMLMGQDLAAARRQLLDALPEVVKPMVKVAEIMSHGLKTVRETELVEDVAVEMQRLGHEGYPVVGDDGRLVGLLTRRAVDRTLGHKLGTLTVRQIMRAGAVKVFLDDSIERVQERMMEEGWGQIPVVTRQAPDELIGIVTRTDLLNLLSQPPRTGRQQDMRRRMAETLPRALWEMVQRISQTAAEQGAPIYFVGGLVRDMLLAKTPTDIDIVVEGDAIALVEHLRSRFGGEAHTHARFGTAKWMIGPDVWRVVAPEAALHAAPESLDFVTARTEFYAHPTALPEVARSSIKLDLHRRDFTINTLAVRLDGVHLGQLLDFYGGQRDLDQGVIRVLHSISFIDDPTRILRAVRLEQRLGFHIEQRTAELIADALPMLSRITGDRIRHELELALLEPEAAAILARLSELGVLAQLHPELGWSEAMAEALERIPAIWDEPIWRARRKPADAVVTRFMTWLLHVPAASQDAVMARLRVRQTTRADVVAARQLLAAARALPADAAPSQAAAAIRPYADRERVLVAVLAVLGDETPATAIVRRYQTTWSRVETALNGHDLIAMGLERGPLIGQVLDALLAARLDGQVASEADERALVREQLGDAYPSR